jgi:hypothetical protein
MRQVPKHLTYANVTSTLALFIALGAGTAFATQLAPKSVGAKQLRPGAVTADRLRKQAVTAPKLPTGAISTEKLANGAVTGEKVDEASLGQVPSANSANFAASAGSADPEAFAKVDAEGTVFAASSKGIGTADVRQGKEAGIYCVNVPGFVPRGAQVTPEFTAHSQVTAFLRFGGTESCPAPHNAGSHQKEPFQIMLYR